ncbi:hypothetical protein B0J17DRAFT_773688 [Rhizoctonia solani]|nr:hypothetical protein B0J17DRAFT_773688 [Rhizoctonia solani]
MPKFSIVSWISFIRRIFLRDGLTSSSWPNLRRLDRALTDSIGVNRERGLNSLQSAVDSFIQHIGSFQAQSKGRQEYEVLRDEFEVLFKELGQYPKEMPPETDAIKGLCWSIEQELLYFSASQDHSTLKSRTKTGGREDRALACYYRIKNKFQRITFNILAWQENKASNTAGSLEDLSPALSARYNSKNTSEIKRGPCVPGTRDKLLKTVYDWANRLGSDSVYWINGIAGAGKTTLAYSLCTRLEASHQLAASFFCSWRISGCDDSSSIIPSVAYQLAQFSYPFRNALSDALKSPDWNIKNRSPDLLFDLLISQPLLKVEHTLNDHHVIVIDALGECKDKEGARQLLDVLLTKASKLKVKFVVSSHPEPDIQELMNKQTNQAASRGIIHGKDGPNAQEIGSYLHSSLNWWAEPLVQEAGCWFAYAETMTRHIRSYTSRHPRAELAELLDAPDIAMRIQDEIDEFYTRMIQSALGDPTLSDARKGNALLVLYLVVSAEVPLTVNTISAQLGMDNADRVRTALRPLWSVLHIQEGSGTISMIHPSFARYILDLKRSKDYCCDPKVYGKTMVLRCFRIFREAQPQFNICGLKSSYLRDTEVNGLKEQVRNTISSGLFYAAQYWAVHLKYTPKSPELLQEVEEFFSVRLLLWMEIMNLKQCKHEMPAAIRLVKDWAGSDVGFPANLRAFIYDAWRFTAAFAFSQISDSTPHIYISMLPFWPDSNPVAKCYTKRMQGMIMTEGTAIDQRQHALWATRHFNCVTRSAVYSPDGTLIAVGVGEEILLLSASTGRLILPPLQGHSSAVLMVRFSPDGARLISTSLDKTIRGWKTKTGELVLGPLMGYVSPPVSSIFFTPDGAFIVSELIDDTVLVWDSLTGKHISVFGGDCHRRSVLTTQFESGSSCTIPCGWHDIVVEDPKLPDPPVLKIPCSRGTNAAFSPVDVSPDGTHVASCSSRSGIYIWNTEDELALGPLTTRNGYSAFTSVSFSPNGSWLVSGSRDGTLCVWDVLSGELVLGPLDGHTDSVTSARFSPDGGSIVSSSEDKTLRFWDASCVLKIPNFLPGHAGSVTSVGISPSGAQIVSGSTDGTICTWDSQSGDMVLGPLEKGRNDRVLIVYSPDGARLLSKTPNGLALLDAQTGSISVGPIKLERSVQSAVFSSDGTRILVALADNAVQVLAADTGDALVEIIPPLTNQSSWVHTTSATFSPNCDRLAIGSLHSGVSIFDAHSKLLLHSQLKGYNNGSRSLAFSPNGAHIVSGSFSSIFVWDVQNGSVIFSCLQGHTEWVHSVEYSPDGSLIVSGARDNAVCVWDARTGNPVLGPIKWHTGPVRSVRFSPDGTQVVSGSDDKTIRVTDIRKNSMNFISSPSTPIGSAWKLNTDGWVVDKRGRLLAWVPFELHTVLMWPRTKLLISNKGWLRLNFSGARFGDSWAKCFRAESPS